MRRRLLGPIVCLILFLVSVPPAQSQQLAEQSWESLKQLHVGQKVEVVDTNLKSLKGTFLSFSEEVISLRTGEGNVTVPRPDVLRVGAHGGGRKRNALVGVAIGALAGLALGALKDLTDDVDKTDFGSNNGKIFAALIGAAIGAGVGAAFPGYHIIYRVKRRSSDKAHKLREIHERHQFRPEGDSRENTATGNPNSGFESKPSSCPN